MINNLEPNKVYDLAEVLQVKPRRTLKQIRWDMERQHYINKVNKYLDDYSSKYGYREYDKSVCNIDSMPMMIDTHKDEYDSRIVDQLQSQGVIHCIWDRGNYNCIGKWSQKFVCRYKDYERVCRLMGIDYYEVKREDVIVGVHDGLWDEIGDLVDDKQYRRNEAKYDTVRQLVINYIVTHMDRFINYYFKYDEYETIERMYYETKRELGIK